MTQIVVGQSRKSFGLQRGLHDFGDVKIARRCLVDSCASTIHAYFVLGIG